MKRQNKSPKGILASMLLVLAVGGCIIFFGRVALYAWWRIFMSMRVGRSSGSHGIY